MTKNSDIIEPFQLSISNFFVQFVAGPIHFNGKSFQH